MALPRKLFDEAIGNFGRKFLFVYRDADGRYGICSECGNTVDYEDMPLPSAQGGDRFRYTECPHCGLTLEVRRGWYSKNSLKDRFYLQAWEVIEHDTVKLHEAIVALDGRTDTEEEAGSWICETCWDQRCTTLTPGHAETVRWNGDERRVASMCPPFEMYGCNIIPICSTRKMMTDQICVGNYAKKHANGTTNIIFIRRAEKPNEPWFTLEVNPKTLDFVQCYGFKNMVKGKDDPEVGPFLKKYAKHLERCAAKNKTRKQEDNKCRKTA